MSPPGAGEVPASEEGGAIIGEVGGNVLGTDGFFLSLA
jgi:hypothetical protein